MMSDTEDQHTLEELAARRGQEKADAAAREYEQLERNNWLEHSYKLIYPTSNCHTDDNAAERIVGVIRIEDYQAWIYGIGCFVRDVDEAGLSGRILQAESPDDGEARALSILKAGVTGGEAAIRRRIEELDRDRDDRLWKEAFKESRTFERIMSPRKAATEAIVEAVAEAPAQSPLVGIIGDGSAATVALGQPPAKEVGGGRS